MPRAGTGVCTAPAGQPVVAGTVISDVVFNALVTDIYTLLTDSLSRTGSGGMTVPLGNPDGVIGSPGIIFTNEAGSGFYRAAANDIRMSIAGVDRASWTTAGFYAAIAEIAGLTVTGTLDATTIDHGGPIDIGVTNATTITAGRAGQSLVLAGNASVTGTFSPNGQIIGPYAWQRVVATGDTSNSSTGATTNITGLSFAATSGNKYLFRAKLFVYSAVSTTGVGVAIATGGPTTSTLFYTHKHQLTASSAVEEVYNTYLEPISPIPSDTYATTSTNPQCDTLEGYMVTTGNGTVQLNLQTEINLSSVTVKAGSYLEWMEFT